MPFLDFKFSPHNTSEKEHLKINFSKRLVEISISGFQFTDKDTKQHVRYIPSLQISGYGETAVEADVMLKESADELMKFFLDAGPFVLARELKKFGWSRDRLFYKEYSKEPSTLEEQLPYLNADIESIRPLTMVA